VRAVRHIVSSTIQGEDDQSDAGIPLAPLDSRGIPMAVPLRRSHRWVAALVVSLALLAGCAASASAPTYTYAPPAGGGTSSATAPSAAPSTPVATSIPSPTAVPADALAFTPGTKSAPRVVDVTADDRLNFTPGLVQAAVGETVTFRIHNVGKAVHEFMVGPLAAAFADKEGTPEVADIGPGKVASLTFTFTGSGPFAFACHAPGHFEHGMAGYVQLVGPGAPAVGTKADPRVIHLDMTDALAFDPSQIAVAPGETVKFVLTNSGTVVHEFQVGPADKVAADEVDGKVVVEKDELDEGSTNAIVYTFDTTAAYAFACHEPGHYEAGMKGTVTLRGG
jgi:uncharacterized cupredoxin-like copper-binding protein